VRVRDQEWDPGQWNRVKGTAEPGLGEDSELITCDVTLKNSIPAAGLSLRADVVRCGLLMRMSPKQWFLKRQAVLGGPRE